MKHTHYLLSLSLVLISAASFAQSFNDGTNLFSIGFGVPPAQRIKNDFEKYYKNYYDYKLNNYGTVVLKYEHGLIKYFGMGLNVEYSGAGVSYQYDDINNNKLRYERKVRTNIFDFYARFNGHYPVSDKFDLYAGVGLGYEYSISKHTDTNPNSSADIQQREKVLDFDYQMTVGARYMIKENMGMFLEVGRATTTAQLGFTFKF